jgi:cytochrome c oxidase subunit 2
MIATTMSVRRLRFIAVVLASVVVGGALTSCAPDAGDALTANAALGQVVAQRSGCMSCHGSAGQGGSGPKFVGLSGSTVRLQDGTTRVADDAYLAEATRDPSASRTAGFSGVMPANTLTSTEVAQVVAYINALAGVASVSNERL